MTCKEMKTLVEQARSYERADLWLEKIVKGLRRVERLRKMGGDDEWLGQEEEDLRQQQEQAQALYRASHIAHSRLQQILGELGEEYMYIILTHRFLKGRTWEQIALTLGGGNTADSVRKAAARYLRKLNL